MKNTDTPLPAAKPQPSVPMLQPTPNPVAQLDSCKLDNTNVKEIHKAEQIPSQNERQIPMARLRLTVHKQMARQAQFHF